LLEEICASRLLAQNGFIAFVPMLSIGPPIPVFEPFLTTKSADLLQKQPLSADIQINHNNYVALV
jgi:hypothetical protein